MKQRTITGRQRSITSTLRVIIAKPPAIMRRAFTKEPVTMRIWRTVITSRPSSMPKRLPSTTLKHTGKYTHSSNRRCPRAMRARGLRVAPLD